MNWYTTRNNQETHNMLRAVGVTKHETEVLTATSNVIPIYRQVATEYGT